MRSALVMLLALTLILVTAHVSADTPSEKGMATVSYTRHLEPQNRQDALQEAKLNALERYIANTNAARSSIFDRQRDQIASQVDEYVLGARVLSEEENDAAKTFTVIVRADINATRLLNVLGSGSTSGAELSSAQHSLLTFLFVARNQSSVRSYDARVVQRATVNAAASRNTTEGEHVRSQSVSTSDQVDVRQSVTNEVGGSSTRKADKVEWMVSTAGEINIAMTGVFADAGFDVVEADQVEDASNGLLNIDRIRQAYGHGDDLPSKLKRDATTGVKQAGVELFALGTLDVGMQDIDPVSGNTRVYVTVTGKVYNVEGRFARTLTAVGPVQYAGLGPDASVARTNALKLAARSAAQQMVDELNNKGIR